MGWVSWGASGERASGAISMFERLGKVIYWAACAVSGLLAVLGILLLLFGNAPNQWFFSAILLGGALLVWLSGRAVLYIFANR